MTLPVWSGLLLSMASSIWMSESLSFLIRIFLASCQVFPDCRLGSNPRKVLRAPESVNSEKGLSALFPTQPDRWAGEVFRSVRHGGRLLHCAARKTPEPDVESTI